MEYPEIIQLGNSEWYVKAIMNGETSDGLRGQFLQEVYHYYVNIRMCVGGNKCNKMRIAQVKEELTNPKQRWLVYEALSIDDNIIDMLVYIAENHIKIVK